jgi:hypothetical protein
MTIRDMRATVVLLELWPAGERELKVDEGYYAPLSIWGSLCE